MEIGTIGAGAFAQTFTKRALKAGHKVKLSNDRGPDSLREIVDRLGPGAIAATKGRGGSLRNGTSCCALGQRARDTRKSSQMEESDSDRWD